MTFTYDYIYVYNKKFRNILTKIIMQIQSNIEYSSLRDLLKLNENEKLLLIIKIKKLIIIMKTMKILMKIIKSLKNLELQSQIYQKDF